MTQPDDFGSGFILIALEFQITVINKSTWIFTEIELLKESFY